MIWGENVSNTTTPSARIRFYPNLCIGKISKCYKNLIRKISNDQSSTFVCTFTEECVQKD